MKYAPNGFRDTNNSNVAVNTFNSNLNTNANAELAVALKRERKSNSNKELKGREEVELPSIRTFQKELCQKIYSKESGEILQILRRSNENIRSSKIAIYDNSSRSAFDKLICDKNTPKSQRLENSDNDYIHLFSPKNNLNPLEKFSSSLKFQSFDNSEGKLIEDNLVNENNSNNNVNLNNNLKETTKNIGINNDKDSNSIFNVQLETGAYKIKSKKKLRSDSNIFKSNNEKSSYDISNGNEIGLGLLRNKSENLNRFNDKLKNPISSMLTKRISENNLNKNNNNDINNNNDNEYNQSEEKSVHLTQSSKNGFPKIFKKSSNNNKDLNRLDAQNLKETLKNLNLHNDNNNSNLNNSPQLNKQLQQQNSYSKSIYNSSNLNQNFENNNNINNSSKKLMPNFNNNNNNSGNHTINSITKAPYIKQKKFFCPHCEHCNVIKDENLEKYFNMKEAKSIVRKSLDFIVTNYQTDQSYLDFLLGNNNPGLSYLSSINADSLQQINTNSNLHLNNVEYENLKSLKNRTKFDIETLLNTYPKHSNNRTVLQLVTHFLDALINDKVSLDSIAGPEMFERLKESLISQGIAFKENEGEIEFDNELDAVFDETTKEKLRKLFKKVGSECKEKAVLLYRVFKLFFVEQEKKWTVITNHMKEKIHYYKELAKTVIQQKNKHLAKIETINDVLFANKVSLENLQNHKNLIKDLLNVVNEKRDQIYLLMSENEILAKEINFWVYDFEKLKLDNSIREKLKELNLPKMVQNVNDEMSHKQVPEAEKLLLVNADRYLIASGQRNYFYDQKNYYLSEIARISELYDNCKFKKKLYKRSLKDMKAQMEREVARVEKDIQYFRDKLSCEKKDVLIQTDVDNFAYNKILKNHNLINFQRQMTYNKLTNFIEKIKFNCSKQKPISKKSVLNFIPEIYNEKLDYDNRLDLEGRPKTTMDEFFIKYMKDKFKLTKIINCNCEQMLMSILKYAAEDSRIDLLRKFLGVGEDKIKREILDCYLTVLKNLPISFYKLFEDGFPDFLMTLDNCYEIFISKFPNFFIHIESLDKLLRNSLIYQAEKEIENLGLESRKDIFLLMKYYIKQNSAFQTLLNEFKNKSKNEESYLNIADQIMMANKEFDINFFQIAEVLKRNFSIIDDKIQLESFLNYFVERFTFKVKITDFLQVCIDSFGVIYLDLDWYLVKMWENADAKRNGIIFYREFEAVLSVLLGNSENKWKISEFFKSACDSPDKDFLSKDEFISFCLNNKELLVILLAERKKNLTKK